MKSRLSNRRRDPMAMVCSSCGCTFLLDETPSPPFCSERCQMIDLGRWLNEEIGVPTEGGAGEAPIERSKSESENDPDNQ